MIQEPSANMRQAAKLLREMYEAYVEAGFSRVEALMLLGAMMGTTMTNLLRPEDKK